MLVVTQCVQMSVAVTNQLLFTEQLRLCSQLQVDRLAVWQMI